MAKVTRKYIRNLSDLFDVDVSNNEGDLLIYNGQDWASLPIGSPGQILEVNAFSNGYDFVSQPISPTPIYASVNSTDGTDVNTINGGNVDLEDASYRIVDPGGDISNDTYTVPEDGFYEIFASVAIEGGLSSPIQIEIKKNGSAISYARPPGALFNSPSSHATTYTIDSFVATDTIVVDTNKSTISSVSFVVKKVS